MTLALPDVTLCAVTGINHELTVRAMMQSLRHCSFADVVLISDRPVEAPFRVEVVPYFSGGWDYAVFVCAELGKYTASPFNLLVQYDSYVVEPLAWDKTFLDYDYIGAKWPWHPPGYRVGNSGFCLRSKRLLDVMAAIELPPVGTFVDDELICHTYRQRLEAEHKIKIAPEHIADMFAYERHDSAQPTFGFHGIFNFWRYNTDAEMEKIVYMLDQYYVPTRAYSEVMIFYYAQRKFRVFCRWYCRLRDQIGFPAIRQHILGYLDHPPVIDEVIRIGEEMRRFYKPLLGAETV